MDRVLSLLNSPNNRADNRKKESVMGDFTDLNTEVVKVLTEGFKSVNGRLDGFDKRLTTIEMGVKEVDDRLFGNDDRKVKAIVDQIDANEDRSHANKRSIEAIEPNHTEMYKFYKNIRGIVVGYTLATMFTGMGIWKLITWLFTNLPK